MERLKRLAVRLLPTRVMSIQTAVLLLVSFFVFTAPAAAYIRFDNRSLMIQSPTPGASTTYTISFKYTTPATIGSVNLLACMDPIPYLPCDSPAGLDMSRATLSDQQGETGFTVTTKTANHIVLSRPSAMTGSGLSTYTFTNVINPTSTAHSFAIRMTDYATSDASGPYVNIGAVLSQVANGVTLETQVPPMLVFCVGKYVNQSCDDVSGGNYQDLGTTDAGQPLDTTSEMAVGTNASRGFVITVNGTTMAAGTHVIPALTQPTVSAPGNNQFGINTVYNSDLDVGQDPEGTTAAAESAPGYNIPNQFQYHDGDIIAQSTGVSFMNKFTVSYLINTSPDLHAGVYTTTLTYICTGRF